MNQVFRSSEKPMSPLDHLEELRLRIIYSLIAWIMFSVIGFAFSQKILDILTKPVPRLVLLTPAEAFLAHLKIALLGGTALAAPFILHQLLLFLLPALAPRERKGLVWVVPMAFILFFSGAAFAQFVLLPVAIRFFLSYTTDKVQEMISLSNYIGFVLSFLIGGGIVFELPLLMMGLGKLGIVKASFLRRYRKEAFVIILIATALLSPSPDVFSWSLLSGCMYGLFELSIILVRLVQKKEAESSSAPT